MRSVGDDGTNSDDALGCVVGTGKGSIGPEGVP